MDPDRIGDVRNPMPWGNSGKTVPPQSGERTLGSPGRAGERENASSRLTTASKSSYGQAIDASMASERRSEAWENQSREKRQITAKQWGYSSVKVRAVDSMGNRRN
jgi:hypothetical protein